MLKIKGLLFVLSLSPLFLLCPLPGQSQTSLRNPPSKGTAGTESGAPTNASQTTILSNPQAGASVPAVVTSATSPTGSPVVVPIVPNVPAVISTGVSTSGSVSVPAVTTPSTASSPETSTAPAISSVTNVQPQTLNNLQISAASVEITSPGATVTNNVAGSGVVISLTPESQTKVNLAATNAAQNILAGTSNTTSSTSAVATVFTGGSGSAANSANSLIANYTAAGVPNQLAQTLVTSIANLLPTPSGIARNVNINNLNDAIVAYNAIILQSGADTVRSLSQNESFVLIGKTLGELRSALK